MRSSKISNSIQSTDKNELNKELNDKNNKKNIIENNISNHLSSNSNSDSDPDDFDYKTIQDDLNILNNNNNNNNENMEDEDEDEDDFQSIVKSINALKTKDMIKNTSIGIDLNQNNNNTIDNSNNNNSINMNQPCTQIRPCVIDDFIRNFLIKINMNRTLDTFNTEWYEYQVKGKLQQEDIGIVPDIYVRNQTLDSQVKLLRDQLKETQEITEKVKNTWDKFRQQRDFHKMHHQRVSQEKKILHNEIKRLKKFYNSYEQTLKELKSKYEIAMKEKMLITLERDRLITKSTSLEKQIQDLEVTITDDNIIMNNNNNSKNTGRPNNNVSGNVSLNKKKSINSNIKKQINSNGTLPKKTGGNVVTSNGGIATKRPTEDGINPFIDKYFDVLNVDKIQLLKSHNGHLNSISSVAFYPNDNNNNKCLLATVSDDETWKLWTIPNCELTMSGEGHQSWIAGVDFHPKRTHLATASGDNTVRLWDFSTATCSLTLSDHSHPVWKTTFHYEGDFLVSCSMDHTAKLWDLATGKCCQTFRGHVDSVNSVHFQPFTANFATASGDKTISIWDIRTGLCVQTFYGHLNACNYVCFNNKADTIASCDADGIIKIWDVRMVAERGQLTYISGGNNNNIGSEPLNSVSFHRGNDHLIAGCADGGIKIYNVNKMQYITELRGHQDSVQVAIFDPSNRFIASAGSDCQFSIWSL